VDLFRGTIHVGWRECFFSFVPGGEQQAWCAAPKTLQQGWPAGERASVLGGQQRAGTVASSHQGTAGWGTCKRSRWPADWVSGADASAGLSGCGSGLRRGGLVVGADFLWSVWLAAQRWVDGRPGTRSAGVGRAVYGGKVRSQVATLTPFVFSRTYISLCRPASRSTARPVGGTASWSLSRGVTFLRQVGRGSAWRGPLSGKTPWACWRPLGWSSLWLWARKEAYISARLSKREGAYLSFFGTKSASR
jgi:hypothetical protein